jgi:hypothetical protein
MSYPSLLVDLELSQGWFSSENTLWIFRNGGCSVGACNQNIKIPVCVEQIDGQHICTDS